MENVSSTASAVTPPPRWRCLRLRAAPLRRAAISLPHSNAFPAPRLRRAQPSLRAGSLSVDDDDELQAPASIIQQETVRYFHLHPEEPPDFVSHVHLPGRDVAGEMRHLPRAKNVPLAHTHQYRAARQRALRAMRADGRVVVAPSVGKADFWNLGRDLTEAAEAGAEWMHFAVLDGRLAPKTSMGSTVMAKLRHRLPETVFDVRLSVAEPEHRVAEFVAAGADIISVHPESTMRLGAVLDDIRCSGCAAGVVINPETPASVVGPVLHKLDLVVIMLLSPGTSAASGSSRAAEQTAMKPAMDKLRELKAMLSRGEDDEDDKERAGGHGVGGGLWIEVEGGVSHHTAAELVAAGANALVVGAALFDKEGTRGKRDAIEAMTPPGQPLFRAFKSFAAVSDDDDGRKNITGP